MTAPTQSAPQYPDTLPLVSITNIVNTLRGGDISEHTADLGYDVWVVQGFGMKTFLGSPTDRGTIPTLTPGSNDAPFTLQSAEVEIDQEMALQTLEAIISDTPTVQASIPWEIILPLLLKLAESWLSNRKK